MGSRDKMFNEKSAKKRLENVEKRISTLMGEIENVHSRDEKDEINKKLEKQKNLKTKIVDGISELKSLKEEIKQAKKIGEKKENTNYICLTEKEARLMKKKDGYIPGYNAQAIVDSKNQMVIASDVFPNCSDAYLGEPMLEKYKDIVGEDNYQKGDKSFDNGYFDVDFIKYSEDNKLNLYFETSSVKDNYNNTEKKPKKNDPGMIYDEKKDVFYCKAGKELSFKRVSYNGNSAYKLYEKYGCKKENCIYYDTYNR